LNLIANYLLESIDETVEPCENFFEFACGTWLKKHRIPYDGKLKNFSFGYIRIHVICFS
jgi:predicted metalloendopeptidase